MRTTLTIDEDLAMDLKEYAHQHGMSFKEVVNVTLRHGLISARGPQTHREINPPTVSLGEMVHGAAPTFEEDQDGEIARFLRVTQETLAEVKSQQK